MIKRSLNERFGAKVLAGVKRTTMRLRPWKLGEVMLYHWAGKPYRSKHVDVCVVRVKWYVPVTMTIEGGDVMFSYPALEESGMNVELGVPLWQVEGFDSAADLAQWFTSKYRPGVHELFLMGFERVNAETLKS